MLNIVVTGTKGKTTITSFINQILEDYNRIYISTFGVSKNGKLEYDNSYFMKKYKLSANVSSYLELDKLYDFSKIGYLIAEASYSLDYNIENTFLKDNIDLGIITNVYKDHIDGKKIKNQDDLLDRKMFVVRNLKKGGTLILALNNAPDNINYKILPYLKENRPDINLIKIGDKKDNDFYIKDDFIFYINEKLFNINELKFSFGGISEVININILIILAVMKILNISFDKLKEIKNFNEISKGRINIFEGNKNKVYLDFAHEPQSIKFITDLIKKYEGKKITGVIRLSYYRENEDIKNTMKEISNLFDKIYIYDKAITNKQLQEIYLKKKNKYLGEVGELMYNEAIKYLGKEKVILIGNEYECIENAIKENSGENIIFYIGGDDIDKSIEKIKEFI